MKLFVTDYDDTLYINDSDIKKNIKYLKKLRQNSFIILISTGRSYPSIKNEILKYNIPYDYVSCADGSIIYDNKGDIVKMFNINSEIIPLIENFYKNLNYEEIQYSYKEGYSNILLDINNLLGINICISNRYYTNKLKNDFFKLKNILPNYNYLAYTHTNFSYLCVKPKDISKSYGIKTLIKMLDIDKKNVYVIGDSSNDFEMIYDYHGVGMKNSVDEILKIVDKTYSSISDYIHDILKNKD